MVGEIGKSLYFQFCCNLEMTLKIVLKNPKAHNTIRKYLKMSNTFMKHD